MRYYPHTPGDVERMLKAIGVKSVDELFSDIPAGKIINGLNLAPALSEMSVVKTMTELSDRNRLFYDRPDFLGAGVYRHFSPSVVDAVISRSEFYTAYTPYQAEASQGVLQSIFEFQTMISMITGMDAANASLYDGSTACAEAVSLAVGHTRKKEMLYSEGLHPEYIEVLKTYFRHTDGLTLTEIPLVNGITDVDALKNAVSKETAGVIVQNPNCLGFVEPAVEIGRNIKEANKNALYIVAVTEPLSLGLLKTPGDCGADIAVGEAAFLGLPPSFGGPFVGFISVKSDYLRKLPGRLVGQTTDTDGKRAFCLTLQAREQHIRREKASSNICSNEALCALAVTVYLSSLGKYGFAELAKLNFEKALCLKNRIAEIPGMELAASQPFFNEFAVKCPDDPRKINNYLFERGVIGGFPAVNWKKEWKDYMIFCTTELNSKKEIDDLVGYLGSYCREEVNSACTIA